MRYCCMMVIAMGVGTLPTANALMPEKEGLRAWPIGTQTAPLAPPLNADNTRAFREWFTLLIKEQLRKGPSPRWTQHDCVGLVRFTVAEALQTHDTRWLQTNGLWGKKTPAEITLTATQLKALRHQWRRNDGSTGAYVSAQDLIIHNTAFISRDIRMASVGDLLFFDQGQAQHVMIWMGSFIAYHTGSPSAQDNGMRAYTLNALMHWPDTRWRPELNNPNFKGIYRLHFLTGYS